MPKNETIATHNLKGLLYIAPFVGLFVFLTLIPFCNGAILSLFKADLFGAREFAGFENFVLLFNDHVFLQALGNTLYFLILCVIPLTIIPLILALCLNNKSRFATLMRGVFFSTSVMSVTIVTLMWRMVLMNDGGLINNLLGFLGMNPVPFLASPLLVMPSMAVITIWWCIGLPMTMYLAALQQIPPEIYEAAELDNSSRLNTNLRIIIPMLAKTIAFVAIVQTIMQFQLFGQPQLITQGGPNGASRPIVLFIFEVGFRRWDIGYAQAASLILTLFIMFFTIFQFKLSQKDKNSGGRA